MRRGSEHSEERVNREAMRRARARAEQHEAHPKWSARKVKREAARAKKCAKRCANGNQKVTS